MGHEPTTTTDRLLTLRKQVEHRDPKALGAAIARMLMRYRTEGGDGETREAMIAAYVSTLSSVPVWAAIKACDEWHTGKYDHLRDPDMPPRSAIHPPAPAELFQAATDAAGWSIRELERLEAVNGRNVRYRRAMPGETTVGEEVPFAPVPEERARVIAGFEALRRSIGSVVETLVSHETPAEIERRRRYDEIAAAARTAEAPTP
jgi:hypothetical protein